MFKTERTRMKRLTGEYLEAVVNKLTVTGECSTAQNLIAAVSSVVEQRMPDMFEMRSDLVCASGFKATFHQRNIPEALHDAIMGYGMFSMRTVFNYAHLLPVLRVAPDMTGYDARIAVGASPDQCDVFSFDGVLEELTREVILRMFSFCCNDQS